MNKSIFTIGSTDVDSETIVQNIQATVARKMEDGTYTDARVARAERTNIHSLVDDNISLSFRNECLREAAFVDINDFKIVERRQFAGRILIRIKQVLWNILKFYTYRLWSQQNQVNGLLVAAIETSEARHRDRIDELEQRIRELESSSGGGA